MYKREGTRPKLPRLKRESKVRSTFLIFKKTGSNKGRNIIPKRYII
jgi:hypothetical protein